MGSLEKSKTGSLFRESEELSGRRVLGRGGNRKEGKRLLCRLQNEVFERRERAEDVHKDRLVDNNRLLDTLADSPPSIRLVDYRQPTLP